jgi:hypothetical protein
MVRARMTCSCLENIYSETGTFFDALLSKIVTFPVLDKNSA